jgi:hypothetical protein
MVTKTNEKVNLIPLKPDSQPASQHWVLLFFLNLTPSSLCLCLSTKLKFLAINLHSVNIS